MAETVTPSYAPQRAPNAEPRTPSILKPLDTDKNALFDSIAKEMTDENGSETRSPLKSVFTALLWAGYAVAIVVALVLVWAAAKDMMLSLPR